MTRVPFLLFLLIVLSACAGVETDTPGRGDINVQVPGSFSLTEGQTAKLTNYRNISITLTSAVLGRPALAGTKMSESPSSVKVYVQVPGGCSPDEECGPPDFNPPVFSIFGEGAERAILGLVLRSDRISEGEAVFSIRFRIREACEDTDGGVNYFTAGTVTSCLTGDALLAEVALNRSVGTFNRVFGNCTISKDQCRTSIVLEEYYCGEWTTGSTEHRCSEGCSEGMCNARTDPQ